MAQKSFYMDSCIWLNLFKKEGDPTKGVPYWKIAEDFIETIMFSQDKEIIYSGFVLKELKYKVEETVFKEKVLFFKEEEKIKFAKAEEEDYPFARKLESELSYELSFFDCLHIAVCKRLNAILVTRDDILIQFAKKYIEADKPENLLS